MNCNQSRYNARLNPLPYSRIAWSQSDEGRAAQEQGSQTIPNPGFRPKRNARKKFPPDRIVPAAHLPGADSEPAWNRIKGRLVAKVALMDKETAQGVAAGRWYCRRPRRGGNPRHQADASDSAVILAASASGRRSGCWRGPSLTRRLHAPAFSNPQGV